MEDCVIYIGLNLIKINTVSTIADTVGIRLVHPDPEKLLEVNKHRIEDEVRE